ncbi:MAG: sulfide/dihydroorotate dehydrogenase-like FAD/NAD-binding protein [Kiritimatiellae bacterium]|nr:sulfide/dihydroorotate dehydrogenase-like FAD/NAD-binding protein [Kiritimatiellia bacterium]
MNKIVSKKLLPGDIVEMQFEAPLVAREHKAGQFLVLRADAQVGERIPLTIADADLAAGTVTVVFQAVGATSIKLSRLEPGEFIPDVLGPLGVPSEIAKFGRVVLCGGGIGIAPIHPIAQAMRAAGNKVASIIAARSKDLLVFEDRMRKASDEVVVCTDDGSAGRKCLVTEPLREMCESAEPPDRVIAIGPPVMMKFCAATTKPFGIPTFVSLNTIMIDGTGMCGGCRVSVGGKTRFVCVDGPDFDGHAVDWDNMMSRMRAFKPFEAEARRRALDHECRLDAAARAAGPAR